MTVAGGGSVYQLKELIEQSRNWTSINRGRELWPLVRDVLQNTFGAEAGMFIFRKRFLVDDAEPSTKIYEPWGLSCTVSELTDYLFGNSQRESSPYVAPERWIEVSEASTPWRQIWQDANLHYAGAWPLMVKETTVGAIVLGRNRPPDENGTELMSLCATYVSLVLECLRYEKLLNVQV